MDVTNGCHEWMSRMDVTNGCHEWMERIMERMHVTNGCKYSETKKNGNLEETRMILTQK